MFKIEIEIERGLRQRILQLPAKLERRVIAKAVNAAGTPFIRAMRALLRPHKHTGNLSKSLKKRVRRYGRGYIVGIYGPTYPLAPHAHLVEYGTAERFQKSGKSTGRMPKFPFRDPAYRSVRGQVQATLNSKIVDGIKRLAEQGKAYV